MDESNSPPSHTRSRKKSKKSGKSGLRSPRSKKGLNRSKYSGLGGLMYHSSKNFNPNMDGLKSGIQLVKTENSQEPAYLDE